MKISSVIGKQSVLACEQVRRPITKPWTSVCMSIMISLTKTDQQVMARLPPNTGAAGKQKMEDQKKMEDQGKYSSLLSDKTQICQIRCRPIYRKDEFA